MIESDILLDALLGAGKYGKMAEQQAAYFGFDNPRKDSQHSKITEKKAFDFFGFIAWIAKGKTFEQTEGYSEKHDSPFWTGTGCFY